MAGTDTTSDHGTPPPGLGPVFAYEWLISSRRWQGYAIRSLFVLFLLAALVFVWLSQTRTSGAITHQTLAMLAAKAYLAVVGTQLTLVLLVAPAATAGAICLDRARGTLTHLLVTDLTDTEIVLGKLAARLVPVLGMIACSLPVMALFTLLGGVDPAPRTPRRSRSSMCVAILGCCLALVFSLWATKTHEALLATYSIWGLWLLGRTILGIVLQSMGLSGALVWPLSDPYTLALNPDQIEPLFGLAPILLLVGTTLAASGVLALVAVWRLRRVCGREDGGRPRLATRVLNRLDGVILWTGARMSRGLDSNPVLWRECRRKQASTWGGWLRILFITISTLMAALTLLNGGSIDLVMLVSGSHVAIGLLALSITAGTSLAEERVRGSLDVLMATPLSTRGDRPRGQVVGCVSTGALARGLAVLARGRGHR